MLQQNLGSFQLPDQLTENIMREVSRLSPVPAPTGKPTAPLALSAVSALVLFLLIGVGTQHLSRFQKPYNLDAASEPTVEIIDAVFVIDSPAKTRSAEFRQEVQLFPVKVPGRVRHRTNPLLPRYPSTRQRSATPKPQWTQTKGPEGGSVRDLFIAS